MSGHPDVLDLWIDGAHAGSLMRGPSKRSLTTPTTGWMTVTRTKAVSL